MQDGRFGLPDELSRWRRALMTAAVVCGCGLFCCGCETEDVMVIGLHQKMGPINPLGKPSRPGLAAQRLQFPALFEYVGHSYDAANWNRVGFAGSSAETPTMPSLVDMSRSVWEVERDGREWAKLVLRQEFWHDPQSGEEWAITGSDVAETFRRIRSAGFFDRETMQQGRLPITSFISFVGHAIEEIEVDGQDDRTVYVRFGRYILDHQRQHALTFRILPGRVLRRISSGGDVRVSATPYYWANADEFTAGADGQARKTAADEYVFRVAEGRADPNRPVIRMETAQELSAYSRNVSKGLYGLAYGLPYRPGVEMRAIPEEIAYHPYPSTDVWCLVLNCEKLERRTRQALVALLNAPESRDELIGLIEKRYAGGTFGQGFDAELLLRRSVFSNHFLREWPGIRAKVDAQADELGMPVAEARRLLLGKVFECVYGYAQGQQVEPDILFASFRKMLARFGVELEEGRSRDRESFVGALRKGEFQIAIFKFDLASQLPMHFDVDRVLPMREEPAGSGEYAVAADADNLFHFAHRGMYEAMVQAHRFPQITGQGREDARELERWSRAIIDIDRIFRDEAPGMFLFSPMYYWYVHENYGVDFSPVSVLGGRFLPRYM